jgi:hypothetical protein
MRDVASASGRRAAPSRADYDLAIVGGGQRG